MKYGDYDNVIKDKKTIYDIISRQGVSLLLKCIAEHIGNTKVQFSLSEEETERLQMSIQSELTTEILERI